MAVRAMRAVLLRVFHETLGLFFLSRPPYRPASFKAAFSVVAAAERALDDPEDLTGKTMAQIGLYPHPDQGVWGSNDEPGRRTSASGQTP